MQIIVNIVVLASLYCLICGGYVLIYRSSRVLNLAHGELMALSAYFLLTVVTSFPGHPFISFGISIGLCFLLGFAVYFFLMRFMTGEAVFAAVLVTISLGILLRGFITLMWTSQSWHPLQFMGIQNTSHLLFGNGVISTFGILAVVTATLVYGFLFLGLKFTRWGLRMRAVGENPLLASQRGINLHWYYALSWALAALTAGLAGMIQACDSGLEPGMFILALTAFPVVLVGGLDSLAGVIPGSLIVASAQIAAISISPQASEVAPFVVLLAMLLIRPWGLFGTKEEWERV
ncbi:MAG: branched-chain amino acid ABC transporter permease [Pseudomonadota bacterium]